MSLIKKVAHNTLVQIVSKVISTALGLWAIVIITRYLGPTGFGEYTTILTFLTFFAVAADFGLTLVTAQMISAPGASEKKILNNLFSFRLVSSVFFLSLGAAAVFLFPYRPEIKFGVLITAISFLFPALNQIIIGLFQKKLSMNRDAIAEVAGRATLIAILIIARRMELGLTGVLIATVLSAAVNFLLHYLFSLKFVSIRWEYDRAVWLKILIKSWPLAVTIVLNLIYLRADTLLLSLFRRVEEVGLYGATYRIIDVLTSVPFMFAGIILPILTASWLSQKLGFFEKVLQKSWDFMVALAIPLAIGAQWFSRPIMLYTGGQDFAAAGPILQILIIGVAAIFPGTVLAHAVIALDKQKKMIKFYVFTSFSALVAYLILIPRFSYYGAAAVTVYSEILIAIFSGYCVYKYSQFRPQWVVAGKSLVSSLIMAAYLYFYGPGLNPSLTRFFLTFLIAAAIYISMMYLLGALRKSDLKKVFQPQNNQTEGGQTFTGSQI